MKENFSGIDVFIAAVETNSFAAAAERLNLSRSAISKTIARLEQKLECRLFYRTTRSLKLTDNGQIYYEGCLRAVDELRASNAILESSKREISGNLRVSVPIQFGRHCIAPTLMQLASENPGLNLELSFNNRPIDLIADGFDLAIRNGALHTTAGLMTRVLCHQSMTVCAAPAYVQKHGTPETIDDLNNHHAITYGHTGRIRSWCFPQSGKNSVEVQPPSRLRFDDLEAICTAAVAAHGLAWLPNWLIKQHITQGTLVPLLNDVPKFQITTSALWVETKHTPLRLRLSIDRLATSLHKIDEF